MDIIRRGVTRISQGIILAAVFLFCLAPSPAQAVINYALKQPALLAPVNNARDVPLDVDLTVQPLDSDLNTLTVTFWGRPARAAASPFTMVVLPDTQYYSDLYPQTFFDQTQWIVENRLSRNIVYVAHEGDLVQHASDRSEWAEADAAMAKLEDPLTTGLLDGIPYGVAIGNHDGGMSFDTYFGAGRFVDRSYYGEGYPSRSNRNHYDLFSAAGMDFVVVYLDYRSSEEGTLDWADAVLREYPNRRAIVVAHSILNDLGGFTVWGNSMSLALRENPNLFLMLCGHISAEISRVDAFNGNSITTLMADYQLRPLGGDGWLRLLEFSPGEDVIRVKTFSPTRNGGLGEFETDADSQFELTYDMNGLNQFEEIGTLSGVASGNEASIDWTGRLPLTQYEWYVTVSDGEISSASPIWRFMTVGFEHRVYTSFLAK